MQLSCCCPLFNIDVSEPRPLDCLYDFMEMENISKSLRATNAGYVPINVPALTAVTAVAVAAAGYSLGYLLSPKFKTKADKIRNKIAAFIAVEPESV